MILTYLATGFDFLDDSFVLLRVSLQTTELRENEAMKSLIFLKVNQSFKSMNVLSLT